MADKERTEDLNPRSSDIEEKVRRMLDPSVPDEVPKKVTKSTKKRVADETSNEPPVHQIAGSDTGNTPADVAEKLDEAIAGLEPGPTSLDPVEDATDIKTAPELGDINEPGAEEPSLVLTAELDSPKVSEADTPLSEPDTTIDDPETDKAVDEITTAESDEILEVEDAIRDTDEPIETPKTPSKFWPRLRNIFKNKRVRKTTLGVAFMALIIAAVIPPSRYFLLNTAGVRARSSVVVLDDSTGLPLKNVEVSLGATVVKTDDQGKAQFEKLRLGPTPLKVKKLAFAGVEKSVTLGLGSNPLGDYKLIPTGEQYELVITDFLSGKPVINAEASSGESSAFSDQQGNIKLTVQQSNVDTITVHISAKDMRTEALTFNADDQKPKDVKLVPGRKHVFISKRSGKYDIYSVYIDGRDEKLVLGGSGHEREDMVLVPHPTANVLAYVSTRANQHNKDGFVLSNLILINADDGDTTNIIASEKIQIIGWVGDRLIFVKTISGESAADPKRNQLLSYNYQDQTVKELASSNYFNDVMLARGLVYVAPSSAYAGGTPAQLYRMNPDGSSQQSLLNQEVWSIVRTAYDHFALSAHKYWFEFQLGGTQATRLDGPPASQKGRAYLDSPDGYNSVWIDQRDGKGVLLTYSLESKKDTTLLSKRGVTYPVSWLNNQTLVYRLNDDQGTADYAISMQGGDPVKIRDVTHIDSTDNWYYY